MILLVGVMIIPISDIYKVFAQERVISIIPVEDNPVGVAYNPIYNNVYVANHGSNTVSVINENNVVVDTIPVGDSPFGIAYNADNDNM